MRFPLLIFWVPLTFLLLGGVFSYGTVSQYNLLPAKDLLELVFVVAAVAFFSRKIAKASLGIALGSMLYILLGLMYFFWKKNTFVFGDILDFVLIYKPFYYLAFMAIVSKCVISKNDVSLLYKTFLWFCLVKYVVAKFLFGMDRPGVLYENNFELMIVVVLWMYLFFIGYYKGFSAFFAVLLVVLFSGSRSGVLMFSVAAAFAYYYRYGLLSYRILLALLAVAVAIPAIFLLSRGGGGLETIDRYKFFMVFLSEFGSFSPLEVLFGRVPITPLSDQSCRDLSYYKLLFSATGSGECYSVILHSFILRAIYDHGFLGLLGISYLFYKILQLRRFSSVFSVGVVAVVFTNGVSVSSFNSIFFALPFLLVLMAEPVSPRYKEKLLRFHNVDEFGRTLGFNRPKIEKL